MTLIQAFCHHCILLDQGRIMAAGEPTDVITFYQERIAEEEALAKEEHQGPSESPANAGCRINSVNLKTENNLPISSGGSLLIELELAVTEPMEGLACAIDIGNAELISITTLVYGYPDGDLALKPPVTTIRCHIEKLPLAPGNYDIRLSLFMPKSATTLVSQGWNNAALPMKVIAEDINWTIIMRQKQNFVHIPAAWELATIHSEPD